MLSTPYVQGRAGQGRQEGRQNQASKQNPQQLWKGLHESQEKIIVLQARVDQT